jgi:Spy/CpxP family protein refolding chaperone
VSAAGSRRLLAAALLALAVLALPAAGQEPRRVPRGERVIEALLIWRLVDELDLSEAQIARIFPSVRELKAIRLEAGRRVPPLLREIRRLAAATPRDEEALRAAATELSLLRAEFEARRRQQLQLIAQALTPEQLARFVLVQETFEAETLRLLQEVRRAVEQPGPRR